MKNKLEDIRQFVAPFYGEKDIMHDFTHLERIRVALIDLIKEEPLKFDPFIIEAALYFHGIIYAKEAEIRQFLAQIEIATDDIEWIVQVAWESQKETPPVTPEGKLLHDAHLLEGGRNFEIIKSLITGSIRGQSLEETMQYIEQNLLTKGNCYTEAGKVQYEIMKERTQEIYQELCAGLSRPVKINR